MLTDQVAAELADPETGCPACKIIIDSGEVQATAWINKPLCSAEVYHAADKLCVLTYSNQSAIMGDSDLRKLASEIGMGLHEMAKRRTAINNIPFPNLPGSGGGPSVPNNADLVSIEQWFVQLSKTLRAKGLLGYK